MFTLGSSLDSSHQSPLHPTFLFEQAMPLFFAYCTHRKKDQWTRSDVSTPCQTSKRPGAQMWLPDPDDLTQTLTTTRLSLIAQRRPGRSRQRPQSTRQPKAAVFQKLLSLPRDHRVLMMRSALVPSATRSGNPSCPYLIYVPAVHHLDISLSFNSSGILVFPPICRIWSAATPQYVSRLHKCYPGSFA